MAEQTQDDKVVTDPRVFGKMGKQAVIEEVAALLNAGKFPSLSYQDLQEYQDRWDSRPKSARRRLRSS